MSLVNVVLQNYQVNIKYSDTNMFYIVNVVGMLSAPFVDLPPLDINVENSVFVTVVKFIILCY